MPDARCQMPDGMAADNSVGGRRYPWTRKRLSDHTARCSWSLNWRSKRLQCDSRHGSTAPPTSRSLLGSRHAWAFPALPNFLFRPNRTPRKEVVQLTLPSLPLSCLHPLLLLLLFILILIHLLLTARQFQALHVSCRMHVRTPDQHLIMNTIAAMQNLPPGICPPCGFRSTAKASTSRTRMSLFLPKFSRAADINSQKKGAQDGRSLVLRSC